MSNKYSFGDNYCGDDSRDQDAVECPQLDALLESLRRACERHGVQFELDTFGEYPSLTMVAYDRGEMGAFVKDLDEADDSIPWIAEARKAYMANKAARQEREEADRRRRELERRERHSREAAEAAQARQQHMVRHGVEIDGIHYKLVKED